MHDHDADDPLPPFYSQLLETLCAGTGTEEHEIIRRAIDALRKLDERDPYAVTILLEWFKSKDRETKPHPD